MSPPVGTAAAKAFETESETNGPRLNETQVHRLLDDVDQEINSQNGALSRELTSHVERWLDWQCRMIVGVKSGGVFLRTGPGDAPLQAAAYWPGRAVARDLLHSSAAEAMRGSGPVSRIQVDRKDAVGGVCDCLALPIVQDKRVFGTVALVMAVRSDPQRQAVLQLLQWGATWLEDIFGDELQQRRARVPALLDLINQALENVPLPLAGHQICSLIADRFACSRVGLGLVRGLRVRAQAMSHQLRFDRRMSRVAAWECAMEECLDQGRQIMFPPAADDDSLIAHAHAALAADNEGKAVYSLPLKDSGKIIAILTLQRQVGQPFDDETLMLLNEAARVLGPLLGLRQRDQQPLWRKVGRTVKTKTAALLGPGHLRTKLIALALTIAVAMAVGIETDYRISARSTVEGTVQQAVVAPQDGYIAKAEVRAGDLVDSGQVLATLDDKELLLEQEKWRSEYDKHAKEHQQARAERDRAQVSILSARMAQARAQLNLIEAQIRRTSLRSPFPGVVVSGDLSQALGAPVERGEVLFEVAPLDSYRVAIDVDEHDVAALKAGQSGQLRLTGFPGRPIDLIVKRVFPVSTPDSGGNHFRVEAEARHAPPELRPGMQGVAKVTVDRGNLLWVWTHTLVDRLRLWFWSHGF